MKQVAKLIIVDGDGRHLLMYRNDHPKFGNDPDLPGGTVEPGESILDALVREVQEEVGFTVDGGSAERLYAGAEYSPSGTHYSLFRSTFSARPTVAMSWEHSSYEWLERDVFLESAKNANDPFMHMVYDALRKA